MLMRGIQIFNLIGAGALIISSIFVNNWGAVLGWSATMIQCIIVLWLLSSKGADDE